MNTNDFTEAARAYAEQACYQDENIPIAEAAFRAGWKAASAHLAAQEPTDAEVEAAARAISAEQDRRIGLKAGAWWGGPEYRRDFAREDARAALSAARAARRDEETR